MIDCTETGSPVIAHSLTSKFGAPGHDRDAAAPATRRRDDEPTPCRFHIGVAGGVCVRCGASWLEHFGPPGGAP